MVVRRCSLALPRHTAVCSGRYAECGCRASGRSAAPGRAMWHSGRILFHSAMSNGRAMWHSGRILFHSAMSNGRELSWGIALAFQANDQGVVIATKGETVKQIGARTRALHALIECDGRGGVGFDSGVGGQRSLAQAAQR